MKLPYFIVDTFTARRFGGNPAGVCPMPRWFPDETLHKIAAEIGISETAFLVPVSGGHQLRWFAPGGEVALCGHATLGAAFVLWECLKQPDGNLNFQTHSGPLTVRRTGQWIVLDLPAMPLEPVSSAEKLVEGLWSQPSEVFKAMDYVAIFDDAEKVRTLTPRFELLKRLEARGVVVAAPGTDVDYVCRFFAPRLGIPEDPATGSAQCALAPYWSRRLGKKALRVHQLSERGGEIYCEVADDRVRVAGQAVIYLEGQIQID